MFSSFFTIGGVYRSAGQTNGSMLHSKEGKTEESKHFLAGRLSKGMRGASAINVVSTGTIVIVLG